MKRREGASRNVGLSGKLPVSCSMTTPSVNANGLVESYYEFVLCRRWSCSSLSSSRPGRSQRRQSSVMGMSRWAAASRRTFHSETGMKIEICFRISVVFILGSKLEGVKSVFKRFWKMDRQETSFCRMLWTQNGADHIERCVIRFVGDFMKPVSERC